MKRAFTVLLALLMCFSLAACGGGSEPNVIHNSQLGYSISTGMEKEKIDELLGEPTLTSTGFYMYPNAGLTVAYAEGKALMLTVTDFSAWKTISNASINITEKELIEKCGEPVSTKDKSGYAYLFDKKMKQTEDKEKSSVIVLFSIKDGSVKSYSVVDKRK